MKTRQERRDKYVGFALQGLLTKYGWVHHAGLVADKAAEYGEKALVAVEALETKEADDGSR